LFILLLPLFTLFPYTTLFRSDFYVKSSKRKEEEAFPLQSLIVLFILVRSRFILVIRITFIRLFGAIIFFLFFFLFLFLLFFIFFLFILFFFFGIFVCLTLFFFFFLFAFFFFLIIFVFFLCFLVFFLFRLFIFLLFFFRLFFW